MYVTCNVTEIYEHNGRASRCRFDITVVHCIASDSGLGNRELDETVGRVTFVPSEVFISSSGFIRLDPSLLRVKARDRNRRESRDNLDLIIL